jgi:hypothetical protein
MEIPYRRFWILGAGRFGQLAVQRIRRCIPGAEIIVVDEQSVELDADLLILTDGITWLSRNLTRTSPVDMVIPAIPVHVAAKWMQAQIVDSFDMQTIEPHASWISRLPHAISGGPGKYYVSHADFICPDNCPEPFGICTYTKKPRSMDLFRQLETLATAVLVPVVIRSHQLLPGVGGLLPKELYAALAKVQQHAEKSLMLATACRCHGVVDFFTLTGRSS